MIRPSEAALVAELVRLHAQGARYSDRDLAEQFEMSAMRVRRIRGLLARQREAEAAGGVA